MSGTSLEEVKLDRTNLAADLFFNEKFEAFACAREVLVTERVDRTALSSLSNVSAIGEANALGNRDHHVGVLCQCRTNGREEDVHIKITLGKIDQIGLDAVDFSADCGSGSQPFYDI